MRFSRWRIWVSKLKLTLSFTNHIGNGTTVMCTPLGSDSLRIKATVCNSNTRSVLLPTFDSYRLYITCYGSGGVVWILGIKSILLKTCGGNLIVGKFFLIATVSRTMILLSNEKCVIKNRITSIKKQFHWLTYNQKCIIKICVGSIFFPLYVLTYLGVLYHFQSVSFTGEKRVMCSSYSYSSR